MDIKASPADMTVVMLYGHNKEWWVDHTKWYDRVKNTTTSEHLDSVFGHAFFSVWMSEPIRQLETVYRFWMQHPQLEEILCR